MTKQKGFSVLHILVLIVVISVVAAGGWLVYDRNKDKDNNKKNDSKSSYSEKNDKMAKTELNEDSVRKALIGVRDSLIMKDYSKFMKYMHSEINTCMTEDSPEIEAFIKALVENFDKDKELSADDYLLSSFYSLAQMSDEEIMKLTVKDYMYSDLELDDCTNITEATKTAKYLMISHTDTDTQESGSGSLTHSYVFTMQGDKIVLAEFNSNLSVKTESSGSTDETGMSSNDPNVIEGPTVTGSGSE